MGGKDLQNRKEVSMIYMVTENRGPLLMARKARWYEILWMRLWSV